MAKPSKPKPAAAPRIQGHASTITAKLCQVPGCERERSLRCPPHERAHELLRLTTGDALDRLFLVEVCAHLRAVARRGSAHEPIRSARLVRVAGEIELLLPPPPAKRAR